MRIIQQIVIEVRQNRAVNKIDKSQTLSTVATVPTTALRRIRENLNAIQRLANIVLTVEYGRFAIRIDLPIDRARLEKENEQLEKVIANSKRQLDNAEIVAKMPEKVVATLRSKLADYEAQLAKNRAALGE
jgi:valyl-tRNA synthetase